MKETLHYVSFLKIQNNIIHKDQSKSKPNVRFLILLYSIKSSNGKNTTKGGILMKWCI
jgi:hypothetical protein